MTIYFITDGTRYHDGDIEEVFGVVDTELSGSFIERLLDEMIPTKSPQEDLVDLFARQNIKYTPLDWEHGTNTFGIPKVYHD